MKLRITDFRDALAVIFSNDGKSEYTYPVLLQRYGELIEALESITDEEIIAAYNDEQTKKAAKGKTKVKSLSIAINDLIKQRILQYPGWEAESYIFDDDNYTAKVSDGTEWRLDFASENALAVEVAFNHGGNIAWNLAKLAISAELNHVRKAVNTRIGVYICATNDMKAAGHFDGAVGSYEKVLRFFTPMRNLLTTPIVLIGLEPPETFYVNEEREIVMK